MKKRVAYFAAAIAITFAGGVGVAAGVSMHPGKASAPAKVYGCKTEDSCKIDFHGGVWTITPDRP